jgi:hypothetical protein
MICISCFGDLKISISYKWLGALPMKYWKSCYTGCLFVYNRGKKRHQTASDQVPNKGAWAIPYECDNFIWLCGRNHWFQWLWSWVNKQHKILQVPKFRMTIGKFAFIFQYTLSTLAMIICFLFMSHIQLKSVELMLSANQFIFWFPTLIAVLAYKIDGG